MRWHKLVSHERNIIPNKRFLNFNIHDNTPFYITRGHIIKTYCLDYDYDRIPNKLAAYCKLTKTHHHGVHDLSDNNLINTKYTNIDDISRRFEANLRMNVSTRGIQGVEFKYMYLALLEFLINEMITQQTDQDTLSNENIVMEYNSEIEGHLCNDLNMFSTRFKSPLIIRGHKTLNPFTDRKVVYPIDCKQYYDAQNVVYHLQYLRKGSVTKDCLEDYAGFAVIPDRRERVFKKPQVIGKVPISCFPRLIVVKAKYSHQVPDLNDYLDSLVAGNIVVAFNTLSTLIGKMFRECEDSEGWGYGHGLELDKPFSTIVLCINQKGCAILNYQLNTLSTLNNEVGIMNQSWSSEFFEFTTPSNITNCVKHLLTSLYNVYYYD